MASFDSPPPEREQFQWLIDRVDAFEHVLTGWESAYPESVFPPLKDGELKHAMKLCNAEDKNQSARLYAEWARHIVKCIRHQVEAECP